jgi:hypothetical protein
LGRGPLKLEISLRASHGPTKGKQNEKHTIAFESVEKGNSLGTIQVVHGDVADQPHGNARYQRSLLSV